MFFLKKINNKKKVSHFSHKLKKKKNKKILIFISPYLRLIYKNNKYFSNYQNKITS